jgi:hypothetical protein
MKAVQVDKLYSKLTPTEQAALAFEAIARNDDSELAVIVDSVEQLDYRCTHWEFRQRGWCLLDLAKYYGLLYWKTRTYMEVVHSKFKEVNNIQDQKATFVFLDRLLAMDVALTDVCTKINIDVMTVKKLALCEDEAAFSENSNPDLVKEYSELFMGIIV